MKRWWYQILERMLQQFMAAVTELVTDYKKRYSYCVHTDGKALMGRLHSARPVTARRSTLLRAIVLTECVGMDIGGGVSSNLPAATVQTSRLDLGGKQWAAKCSRTRLCSSKRAW